MSENNKKGTFAAKNMAKATKKSTKELGVKAILNCEPFGTEWVYDLSFEFNKEGIKNIKNIENLSKAFNGNGYYVYSSGDQKEGSQIGGVFVGNDKALKEVLSKIMKAQIDVVVGKTTIGGTFDEDAQTIVKTFINKLQNKYNHNMEK